jgi:hypothetical protein
VMGQESNLRPWTAKPDTSQKFAAEGPESFP